MHLIKYTIEFKIIHNTFMVFEASGKCDTRRAN